jgi:carboxyl-terminal processing protease
MESGLRLTTALYYTPSGRSIHNKGITPDFFVTDLTRDQERELLRHGLLGDPDTTNIFDDLAEEGEEAAESKAEAAPAPEASEFVDIQLEESLKYLRRAIETHQTQMAKT